LLLLTGKEKRKTGIERISPERNGAVCQLKEKENWEKKGKNDLWFLLSTTKKKEEKKIPSHHSLLPEALGTGTLLGLQSRGKLSSNKEKVFCFRRTPRKENGPRGEVSLAGGVVVTKKKERPGRPGGCRGFAAGPPGGKPVCRQAKKREKEKEKREPGGARTQTARKFRDFLWAKKRECHWEGETEI